MTEANDSAMPYVVGGKTLNGQDDYSTSGLSKREYFAARAMQGFLANPTSAQTKGNIIEALSRASVIAADSLIEELNKIK